MDSAANDVSPPAARDKCVHSGEAPPPDRPVPEPDRGSHRREDEIGCGNLLLEPNDPAGAHGRLVQFYAACHPELLRATRRREAIEHWDCHLVKASCVRREVLQDFLQNS